MLYYIKFPFFCKVLLSMMRNSPLYSKYHFMIKTVRSYFVLITKAFYSNNLMKISLRENLRLTLANTKNTDEIV